MNNPHQLQVIFRDKDGKPCANARYQLYFKGQKLTGLTDEEGRSQLLQFNKAEPVEIWILQDGMPPHKVGTTKLRSPAQKPTVIARQTAKPKVVKTQTENHSTNPTVPVQLKKYSIQFHVPTFSCSGHVSYRMVQDGMVVAEGKTKGNTIRVYTNSDSEVSLYIAGDKRYKKGEAYVEEESTDGPDSTIVIEPFAKANPVNNHRHVENTRIFDKHDWVDVSIIYNRTHPEVIPESEGIYRRNWTPLPKPKDRHRRYVVKIDGREVVLFWEDGSCDNGLGTSGRKTCTSKNDQNWYMTVDQVIARTHPKVFKVLFDVIKELKLTYVRISSSWRPGIGSSAHREGRALDITQVTSVDGKAAAKDFLPHSQVVDHTDSPSGTEPDLIEKVRKSLYDHPEVEQLFDPWYMMKLRGKSFKRSFTGNYIHKKGDMDDLHRTHLHFHVKLD